VSRILTAAIGTRVSAVTLLTCRRVAAVP